MVPPIRAPRPAAPRNHHRPGRRRTPPVVPTFGCRLNIFNALSSPTRPNRPTSARILFLLEATPAGSLSAPFLKFRLTHGRHPFALSGRAETSSTCGASIAATVWSSCAQTSMSLYAATRRARRARRLLRRLHDRPAANVAGSAAGEVNSSFDPLGTLGISPMNDHLCEKVFFG